MTVTSLLDEFKKGARPKCPKCGNTNMIFLSHLQMYGGYVCNECDSIWSINNPDIKKQKKR